VYGANDGLAFGAMCAARKRRKNRQGGLKLFSVSIFWLLFYQEKIAIAIMNAYKKQIIGE